jgi:hypothetical protein
VCALPNLPAGGGVEVVRRGSGRSADAVPWPAAVDGDRCLPSSVRNLLVWKCARPTWSYLPARQSKRLQLPESPESSTNSSRKRVGSTRRCCHADGRTLLTPTDPPVSNDGLSADDYEVILTLLRRSSGHTYMGDALTLLRRSCPQSAESIRDLDPEMKCAMLISILSNEMKAARGEQPDGNLDLDVGDESRIIPVLPPPPPLPTTFYCSICQEDKPMEEMFIVRGCDHQFCRESIEQHISQCLKQKNLRPRCPECTATISDADISMVLTQDQMLHYYNLSVMAGSDDAPDTHKCAAKGCHGVALLDRDGTHFRCRIPSCQAERCVTCNTREWHEGQTCE